MTFSLQKCFWRREFFVDLCDSAIDVTLQGRPVFLLAPTGCSLSCLLCLQFLLAVQQELLKANENEENDEIKVSV